MEEREFVGKWWLPNDHDNEVGGVLQIEASGRSRLKLTDVLPGSPLAGSRGRRTQSASSEAALLHGVAEGKHITVVRPYVSGGRQVIGGQAGLSGWDELTPQAVLIGVHLDDEADALFEGVKVEIDNLTAWSRLVKIPWGYDSNRNLTITATQPEGISAQLASDTVTLTATPLLSDSSTIDRFGMEIHARTVAKIARSGPVVWRAFYPVIKSLQDLLTLATRYPCAVRSTYLVPVGAEGPYAHVELVDEGIVTPRADQKPKDYRFLFTLEDADLQELLTKWTDLRERLGLGIHVLFGLDYVKEGFYENRLFNATSVAEALHRALHSDSVDIDQTRYDKIKQDLEQALSDGDFKWIKGRLRNDPGYKTRLRELAALPDQEAVSELLGDVDTWVKWLGNARNDLAHLNPNALEKVPEAARPWLARVTIALMHLVLLHEIGISPEKQRTVVRNIYGGHARSFKAAMAVP